jgi:predicted transcriptional regulator
MHLQRLESAGLIEGKLELSDEGKAMKYFEVTPFALHLTPERIAEAMGTLSTNDAESGSSNAVREAESD